MMMNVDELNIAIKMLKLNKLTDPDGFISEWYKSLKEPLTPCYLPPLIGY